MWYSHYHHFWPVGIIGWFIVVVCLVPYFLPTIIAILRKKQSAGGIFVLNLLLGWTVIGWVGALIWSLTADAPRETTVIVNNPPPSPPPQSHGYTNVTLKKPVEQQDKYDQLRKLKQLFDDGVLTEEEFLRQKASILG
jgi:hypothetical protein